MAYERFESQGGTIRAIERFLGSKPNYVKTNGLLNMSERLYPEEAPTQEERMAAYIFLELFHDAGIEASKLKRMSRRRFEKSYDAVNFFYVATAVGQMYPSSPWHVLGEVKRMTAYYQDLNFYNKDSPFAQEYRWHVAFRSNLIRSLYSSPSARNRRVSGGLPLL